MKNFVAFIVLTAQVSTAAADGPASDGFRDAPSLKADGYRALFDGSDLAKWNVEAGHQDHWTVKKGVIHYDGQATQTKHLDKSLWTRNDFGEATLYVEWRFATEPRMKPHPIVLWNGDFLRDESGKRITRERLDAGDSGILFRGVLKCQANIWCQEMGSGEINGYRVNKKLPQTLRRSCIPVIKADNPLGDWNAFEVTMKNDTMTVVLNGQTVLESGQLPDLPPTGPIGLQHHGDPVEFRNIWVKEVTKQ